MTPARILITGGSGRLGRVLLSSGLFPSPLAPSRAAMDITMPDAVEGFFLSEHFDAVIHCAARARMGECEADPVEALRANVAGTAHLVVATLKKQLAERRLIRFVHISTDGVYAGARGLYAERDPTIPYNVYGWTKLAAEAAVRALQNHCIVRTSFFDPRDIRHEDSPMDMFSSKLPLPRLVMVLARMVGHSFVGTVNVGGERMSEYDRFKPYKPSLRPCLFADIERRVRFPLAKDSSLDCTAWRRMGQEAGA